MSNTYNDRREAARRELRTEEAPARTVNVIGWALTLIAVVCAIGAFALIIRNELGRSPTLTISTAQPAARPVVVQPVTINPDAPAQAQPTARPVAAPPAQAQPAPAAVQVAPQFSPVDLGDVPAPPAQTSLSPEQYAASQASEEQTFLNNANAGLTPAQRAVAEYNACVQAGGCGVVR